MQHSEIYLHLMKCSKWNGSLNAVLFCQNNNNDQNRRYKIDSLKNDIHL